MTRTKQTGQPRAADPLAGFTDMQWFMFHQRNVAIYAAFVARTLGRPELLELARQLIELAPQLRLGYKGADAARPIDETLLDRLITVTEVESFEGFPDSWLNARAPVADDPALPLFRLQLATLSSGPDAAGRAAFLLVSVSHALVEGVDSSSLSRSRSAAHLPATPIRAKSSVAEPLRRIAAGAIGPVVAGLHLLAAHIMPVPPGPFVFVTRAIPRAAIAVLARQLGVRQRVLLFALVLHTVFAAGTPNGKPRISVGHSSIDPSRPSDAFMQMRMRFQTFTNRPDFQALLEAIDLGLTRSEAKEDGFAAAIGATGLAAHRRLSRLLPFAYTERLFQFIPYDFIIGLIPPHRLNGGLTAALLEPVYAGAATPGTNACVIVPGRRWLTFNFYLETGLSGTVLRLDSQLDSFYARFPFILKALPGR